MSKRNWILLAILTIIMVIGAVFLVSCTGSQGPPGPPGPQGSQGPAGPAGTGLTAEQSAALDKAGTLVNAIPFPSLDQVARGCPACHTGTHTLAAEAIEVAEANGGEHPDVFKATDDVSVTVCLTCHASGTGDSEGKGTAATWSLRDIVHPAHMSSQYFKLHYGGNCFTCHNIDGEGNWDLLTQAVDVNNKGVPNPDKLPIPGAQEIK